MSLVYPKISDEIGVCFMCASRVSTCECSVRSVWYRDTRCTRHQIFGWLRSYESLLTYVAHKDLVGDPLQDTHHSRVSKILITKIHKIFYLGIGRTLM
jgi:hypothetical protein